VCIVTENVILSSHSNRTLKGLRFQYHSDVQRSITTKMVPYIIVQLYSLHRVESHYDVFICDEGLSLVQSFNYPTMHSRGLVMARFSRLLQSSEYLVVCDADLSDVALTYSKSVQEENSTYLITHGRSCQFVTN